MIRQPDSVISLSPGLAHFTEHDYRVYIDGKKTYFAIKRMTDILLASVFIVAILSWLAPLVAILIKCSSRGPVFFLQRRVGKGGRPFTCYKFRTMVPNREADRLQAAHNDKRITATGRVLRTLNIDELPQLLNVLLGDMSLVGPRPHMHADYYTFSSFIPEYTFRDLVRPGMTGLAQVKGYSGPALDRESIFGRYQWDAFYIRNAGFLLDMRVLRKTAWRQCRLVIKFFFLSLFTRH